MPMRAAIITARLANVEETTEAKETIASLLMFSIFQFGLAPLRDKTNELADNPERYVNTANSAGDIKQPSLVVTER